MCIARGLHQITHPTSFHWLPTALVTIATGEEAGIFFKGQAAAVLGILEKIRVLFMPLY